MEIENERCQLFLVELCRLAAGDTNVELSMYDVGAAIGMERDESGVIAEELIIDGFAELVSLSGGVSITSGGLKHLNHDSWSSAGEDNVQRLGNGPVLDSTKRHAVEDMLEAYRNAIRNDQLSYTRLEEIIIDIKTLEIQLISAKPKTPIVRAVLNSLAGYASTEGMSELKERIEIMAGS